MSTVTRSLQGYELSPTVRCFATQEILHSICDSLDKKDQTETLGRVNHKCHRFVVQWRRNHIAMQAPLPIRALRCLFEKVHFWSWESVVCVNKDWQQVVTQMLREQKAPKMIPVIPLLKHLIKQVHSANYPGEKKQLKQICQYLKENIPQTFPEIYTGKAVAKMDIARALQPMTHDDFRKVRKEIPKKVNQDSTMQWELKHSTLELFNKIVVLRKELKKTAARKPSPRISPRLRPQVSDDAIQAAQFSESVRHVINHKGLKRTFVSCMQLRTTGPHNDTLYHFFMACIGEGYLSHTSMYLHVLHNDFYKKAVSGCLADAYMKQGELERAIQTIGKHGYPRLRVSSGDSPGTRAGHHPSYYSSGLVLLDIVKKLLENEDRVQAVDLIDRHRTQYQQDALTPQLLEVICLFDLKNKDLETATTAANSITDPTIRCKLIWKIAKAYRDRDQKDKALQLVKSALDELKQEELLHLRTVVYNLTKLKVQLERRQPRRQ